MKKVKKYLLSALAVLFVMGMMPQECQMGAATVQAATVVGAPKLSSATVTGTSNVTIKWQKAWRAEGYRVYRKEPGKGWKGLLTIPGGTKVSYTDTTAFPGTQYYYTVRAYKAVNGKKVLSSYNTKGLGVLTGLDTPQLVSAKHQYGPNTIKVQWKPVKGAKGYVVYKKYGSYWVRKQIVKPGSVTYWHDTYADDSANNYYTVRAYTNYGNTYKYSGHVRAGVRSDAFSYSYIDATLTKISSGDILADTSDGLFRLSHKDFGNSIDSYQVGDQIRIQYYGSILEVYPAQFSYVVSITKL